ncbi:hypothetical protein HNQ91_002689 [Filimonas zeae]|nr:hypothetical protein [Filimonas zeae]MDR6339624.1 hypothetical protein [Filimonas zeae]
MENNTTTATPDIFATAISIEKLEPRLELSTVKTPVVFTGDSTVIR